MLASAIRLLVLLTIEFVFLIEKQPSAFTISDYKSGFHGVRDGKIVQSVDCPGTGIYDRYILQPDSGVAFHSQDFVSGYVNGWCLVNDSYRIRCR